jgi:hypothetical protein
MIRLGLAVFIIALSLAPAAHSAEKAAAPAQFFSSMQDIPLVPGLAELKEQTVTFDKPEGRIVESVAEIESGNFASVQSTYEQTLPQLGWTKIAENSYAREDEFLHLNYETYDGRNFLRVMVRPRDSAAN